MLTYISICIVVGLGIYFLSTSFIWVFIGSIIIDGSLNANFIIALIDYPLLECLFNDGVLVIYSAISR